MRALGAYIGEMPIWQNKEAAVIGNELETTVLMPKIPTNPAVSAAHFKADAEKVSSVIQASL